MIPRFDVVIVGAGHGGAQAALALRHRKFAGSIGLVGEEPEMPYDRPPLSKEYLAGEKSFARMLLRSGSLWEAQGVSLLPKQRVVRVDPAERSVTTDDGTLIEYGTLIWAAGGKPRRLNCSGHELAGVHYMRSRADVDRMVPELTGTERIAVIGAGYIGLETAATLRKLGKQVIVLEALDRVLARVAGEPLSRFYEAEHRAHGVDVRLGTVVECIEGDANGRACGVRLAGGEVVACEMVIVGIGITPEVGPLHKVGAECGNGLAVDSYCQTSLPDIYALGDCALHSNWFAGGAAIRLESVQNAIDMANTVAKVLTGVREPYFAAPWFWSNQYDLRLQTVGLSMGHEEVIVRGTPSQRSFSIIYRKQGRVMALDCVNNVSDYVQGRKLVMARAQVDRAALEDTTLPLKTLLPGE